jgi:hypothetical protein
VGARSAPIRERKCPLGSLKIRGLAMGLIV